MKISSNRPFSPHGKLCVKYTTKKDLLPPFPSLFLVARGFLSEMVEWWATTPLLIVIAIGFYWGSVGAQINHSIVHKSQNLFLCDFCGTFCDRSVQAKNVNNDL